jgi:diguanylate cyclase (GGDEF)-like protein
MHVKLTSPLVPTHSAAAHEAPAHAGLARESATPALVLVCDHRGEQLAERLGATPRAGRAARWRVETSAHLQRSLERVQASEGARPAALVIDPLVRSSAVEIEALAGAAPASLPILLVLEPGNAPLSALAGHLALQARPWDFAWASAGNDELELRLARLLQQGRDQAALCAWREQARHDERTGLLRPLAFEEHLVQHFSAAQRHGLDLALVLVDLDRFGEVNKRHDHTVGDELIARVGQAIRRGLRQEDCAGRLGGDEFGLLLPYTRAAEAARVLERLREDLSRLVLPSAMGAARVHASAGFETYDGRDLADVRELRAHAERALREVKQRGGDGALYYRALDRSGGRAIESALR